LTWHGLVGEAVALSGGSARDMTHTARGARAAAALLAATTIAGTGHAQLSEGETGGVGA
jgi:hypothetical protein